MDDDRGDAIGRVKLEGVDDRADRAIVTYTYRLKKAMLSGTAIGNGIDVPGDVDNVSLMTEDRIELKGIDDRVDRAVNI
ncbi:hypothetical protein ES708_27806 [subsurface metagenome]